jgi:hypothetical protein
MNKKIDRKARRRDPRHARPHTWVAGEAGILGAAGRRDPRHPPLAGGKLPCCHLASLALLCACARRFHACLSPLCITLMHGRHHRPEPLRAAEHGGHSDLLRRLNHPLRPMGSPRGRTRRRTDLGERLWCIPGSQRPSDARATTTQACVPDAARLRVSEHRAPPETPDRGGRFVAVPQVCPQAHPGNVRHTQTAAM